MSLLPQLAWPFYSQAGQAELQSDPHSGVAEVQPSIPSRQQANTAKQEMVRISSTPDVARSSTAAGTQPGPGAPEENGKNMTQLIYEILNRLTTRVFWPTVDGFVVKYHESPFQALLLATMFLLALVPLSAIVAILFLFATLATILFMITLQITLVCFSIFVAACLSVLSILKLGPSGLDEVTEDLRHVRALVARYFNSSASPEGATRTSTNNRTFQAYVIPQNRGVTGFIRYRVLPKLSKPKVTLAFLTTMVIASIMFLSRPCQCPEIPEPVVCDEPPTFNKFIKHFIFKKP